MAIIKNSSNRGVVVLNKKDQGDCCCYQGVVHGCHHFLGRAISAEEEGQSASCVQKLKCWAKTRLPSGQSWPARVILSWGRAASSVRSSFTLDCR